MAVGETISRAWCGALGITEVRPDDNFFEIGGDSLAAAQVLTALAEAGLVLDFGEFYQRPTVAAQEEYFADRTEALPLTPLQSALFVEALRRDGDETFWLALAYRLPPGTTPGEVRTAWADTVRRNPVLRTEIALDRDGARQIVHRTGPPLDLVGTPVEPDGVEDWCAARVREAARERVGAALRAFLLDGPDPVLALVHHHVLMDGWSLAQCVGDFFAALASGAGDAGERPSAAGYFAWLETTGAQERDAGYWATELKGVGPARPLAFERAGGSGDTGIRERTWVLPGETAGRLHGFCREHGLTPAAVVTTLWARILRRHQDERGITVGMTVSTRPPELPGAAEMSGLLINTVPIRIGDGDDLVAEARAVMARVFAAVAHSHLPHVRLLELAGLPPRAELFASTVVFQNFRGAVENADVLVNTGTGADPLSLAMDVRDDRLVTCLEWDSARYRDEDVLALGAALEDELARLGAVVPGQEWDIGRLMDRGQDGAVAVRDGETTLTYAEFRDRVRRLAAHLSGALGVRAGDRVLLVGERGAAAAIGICAVWLLGASWCAADPAQPRRHRDRIAATLDPAAVVDLAATAAIPDTGRVVPAALAPETVAYFVATSGSTGEPKLVALTAGGLAPLVSAWESRYGFAGEPQNVLQLGSWTSDVFLGDLLKSLATGGTLEIVPDRRRVDAAWLAGAVADRAITLVESIPTVIAALLRELPTGRDRPESLRTVIVGSDTFRVAELAGMRARCWPGLGLYNGYGLSECTIESVVQDCAEVGLADSGLCPLGTPLPGTLVRVSDEDGRDVSGDTIGELVLGGPQVALGYLTADGMDTSRFPVVDGVRWFRTGDLVRRTGSGLEFYGRYDAQVKVRGHRVHLGAVENAILADDDVAEAYVCPVATNAGTELVAFLSGDAALTPDAVVERLRDSLPGHAVPGHVEILPELPRNANGKIDRPELRGRAESLRTGPVPVASDDSALAKLTAIWQDLLARPVDVERSFFDQGGHSLLVLTLFERMCAELPGHGLTVADLFRFPTIAAQAAELSEGRPR